MDANCLKIRKVRHKERNAYFLLVEGRTIDGRRAQCVLRASDALKSSKVIQALLDRGFEFEMSPEIARRLTAAPFDDTIVLTGLTGWHGRQYIRPEGEVLGSGGSLVLCRSEPPGSEGLLETCTEEARVEALGGTLQEWINGVAEPAKASSTLSFAIAVSLAALILGPCGGESGLFHLTSPRSSQGKTTSLLAALSVHRRAIRGSIPTWDITQMRMEESAAHFRDSLLPLDEIALLGDTPTEAAIRAKKVAFTLAAGTGKGRSERFSPAGNSAWRMLALSTGETSFNGVASGANRDRLAGDMVRAIDCPLSLSRQHGIFDRLSTACDSGDLLRSLEAAASENYGVAAYAFVDQFSRNWDYAIANVTRWRRKFIEHVEVPSDGWELRFGARFSIVYAAARLGRHFDILPWSRDFSLDVVATAYRSSRAVVHTKSDSHRLGIERIQELLCDSDRFVWIDELRSSTAGRTLGEVDGILVVHQGDLIYAVKPDVLQSWLGADTWSEMEGHLLAAGYLVADSQGGSRRQASLGRNSPRPRLCWLRQSQFLGVNQA